MARVCEICKRGTIFGNKISHSNKKASRKFMVNIQNTKVFINNVKRSMRLCTKCQDMVKKGILNL